VQPATACAFSACLAPFRGSAQIARSAPASAACALGARQQAPTAVRNWPNHVHSREIERKCFLHRSCRAIPCAISERRHAAERRTYWHDIGRCRKHFRRSRASCTMNSPDSTPSRHVQRAKGARRRRPARIAAHRREIHERCKHAECARCRRRCTRCAGRAGFEGAWTPTSALRKADRKSPSATKERAGASWIRHRHPSHRVLKRRLTMLRRHSKSKNRRVRLSFLPDSRAGVEDEAAVSRTRRAWHGLVFDARGRRTGNGQVESSSGRRWRAVRLTVPTPA